MPRSRNTQSSEFPYHVTARTNHKVPFPCELNQAWRIFSQALWFYSRACEVRVLAFVLMNNHFHLIIHTPKSNLSYFMKLFMKKTSDEIQFLSGQKNHLYGGRYYPSLISNPRYYDTVLKYVYQNPKRANLCNSVIDYKYSTLHGLIGLTDCLIPVHDDFGLLEDLENNLWWLDEMWNAAEAEQIRKGLRVQDFKPLSDKNGYLDKKIMTQAT